MNSISNFTSSLVLSVAFIVAGCAVDVASGQDDPDQPMGVTTQPLTGLAIGTWGGIASNDGLTFTDGVSNSLDLGVGTGWTCWLGGVGGDFSNFQGAIFLGPLHPPSTHNFITVSPYPGRAGTATAVCAPSTDLGGHSANGNPGSDSRPVLTSPTSKDWCGLAGFWGSGSGSMIITNNTSPTNPQVTIFGQTTWTVAASAGIGMVTGECARATPQKEWTYAINGPGTFDLLRSDGTPLPVGTICFLTMLQGSFTTNSFSDGVFLGVSGSGVWNLTAASGKSGRVMCVL